MFNNMLMGAAGESTKATSFSVSNSTVLNDGSSQSFKRTPSSAASERIGTFSMWVKRGVLGTNQMLFSNERDDGAGTQGVLEFQTDDQLRWKTESTAGANIMVRETTQVFRDPHAWYHIMVTWNSNNTDDTCASVWVNGSQVTDFATKTNFGSAQDIGWPSTTKPMTIGAQYSGANYSDVYLSEFVYLDGTASSNATDFGEYDENGVWRPINVSGLTFGTNGFYLPFTDSSFLGLDNSATTNSPGAAPVLLMHFDGTDGSTTMTDSSPYNQSCTAQDNAQIDTAQYKFGGAALLLDGTNDRVSVADDSSLDIGSNDFTLAGWVRFNGSPSGDATFIAKWRLSSGQREFRFYYENSSSELRMVLSTTGSNEVTVAESWSPSADTWYHLAASRTGGKIHLFVDGTQLGSGTSNSSSVNNAGHAVTFGCTDNAGPVAALDGWLDEWIFLNGTGIYSSNFTPPTSAYAINNSFTDVNSPTQSGDSPTTNHCVWSPLTMNLNASSSLALSSGNLVVSNTASEDANLHGSFGLSAGKWYFEVTVNTINEIFVGVSDATIASNANAKNEAGAWVLDLENADKYNNDGGSSYGSAFSNSDVANVALDLDNGKIWIGKDGTYPNSGNPATGANEMYSGISGTVFPFLSTQGGGTKQVTTNFGQSSFTTSAPSGFEPWNTAKMYEDAAPAIEDGSANMQTTIYTGNGGSLSVTQDGTAGDNFAKNSTFKPDLLWTKKRGTGTGGHAWFDIVRTGSDGEFLRSDNTDEEKDEAGFASFDVKGFSWDGAGTEVDINVNTRTYVAWQWLADNTTGSSNTDGRKASDSSTITSTVSANQTAGFSIVKWTGNASNSTIGHGLAATPQVVIVKNRSVAGGWYVGHIKAGFNYELRLDETGARAGSATLFNETAPTSSVFSLGTAAGTNGSTNNMIAYCWAEKEGYSKFGSYEGNDAANGPFVYLGFKPAWIMIKNIDASGGWPIFDNTRTPSNPSNKNLNADQAAAEYSPDYPIDFLSNGFKIRDAQAYVNDANTYVYMAFAEHPFAGTTPATAR